MAEPAITLASFMRDISRHQLIVHHDDGVYRHITGKRPGTSCMHFNVVTFPGYLAYTGDMGAYTFCRTHDMFTFFRQKPGRFGYINPHYWAEKLEATNCNGENVSHGAAEWSDDRFKEVITEYFNDHFASCEPDEYDTEEERTKFAEMKAEVWEQIQDEIFGCDNLEHEGYTAARDFNHKESGLEFNDLWDHRFTDWSRSFLWACYAITWAITKYDQRPDVPASYTTPCDDMGTPMEMMK